MKELELLDAPAPHAPYRRLAIPDADPRIGGPGSEVEVQAIRGHCRMTVVGGQPMPRPEGVCVAVPFPAGVFEVQLSLVTVWVRVVDEAVPPPGWPEHPACVAAEKGAPGPGAVQVLVDALLEAGHPFGEALRTAGDRRGIGGGTRDENARRGRHDGGRTTRRSPSRWTRRRTRRS